jgi:hypothetical protein
MGTAFAMPGSPSVATAAAASYKAAMITVCTSRPIKGIIVRGVNQNGQQSEDEVPLNPPPLPGSRGGYGCKDIQGYHWVGSTEVEVGDTDGSGQVKYVFACQGCNDRIYFP